MVQKISPHRAGRNALKPLEKRAKLSTSYLDQANDLAIMLKDEISLTSTAHGYIKDAIAELAHLLSSRAETTNRVSFIEAGHSGHGVIFGQRSVWTVVAEMLDPAIQRLYAEVSLPEQADQQSITYLPLKKRLVSTESAGQIANMLFAHHDLMGEIVEETVGNGEAHLIVRHGDSFYAVASVLNHVRTIVQKGPAHNDDLIFWCQFCFRRVGAKGLYCSVHSPNEGAGGRTEYEAGKRIRALAEIGLEQSWAIIRSRRRVLLDSFTLVSSAEDITAWELEGAGEPYVRVEPALRDLHNKTKHGEWLSIAKYWDVVLVKCCPSVATVLGADASSFPSWTSFVEYTLRHLDNRAEESLEPYWIFYMLIEAQDWLSAEAKFRDTRRTDTPAEIARLHAEGFRQVDIVNMLGVTKGYVSRILKNRTDRK